MSEKVKLYDKILFRGEFMKPFRDYEISKIIESRKNDIKKFLGRIKRKIKKLVVKSGKRNSSTI